jgi:hypothetical protein
MPDSKHVRWDEQFETGSGKDPDTGDAPVAGSGPAANDADGWQQYRRWINKAPAPRSKRPGLDPSLYSWKGYRDWTDQVRRNWDRETTDEE